MFRHELQELQTMSDYPSLSIIAPTHRTAPHNLQDPIRLRNLVHDATSRLLDDFPRREVAPLLERLDFLVEQIDWRYTLDGLALFANRDCAAGFDLPFSVTERFLIDNSFATRDLIFAMNRSLRYRVLVLGETSTQLFLACGDQLQESHAAHFPISQLLAEQAAKARETQTEGHSVYTAAREAYDRAFLRCIDERLAEAVAEDRLPIVVAGAKRNLGLWKQVSTATPYLAGMVDYDESTDPVKLEKLTRQAMERFLTGQRAVALEDLDEAVRTKRYASGIGAVWQTAHDGRTGTLLVERDFHYTAWLHPCGLLLNAVAEGTDAEFMPNAVDNVIERVLSDGGRVVFMESGSLDGHFHIASILHE